MKRIPLMTVAAWLGSLTFAFMPQTVATQSSATEAPAGFDNLTNGFVNQRLFDKAAEAFEEREGINEGLGPLYNAQSCAECHQSPVTGAISQITEFRAGHYTQSGGFIDHPGGSLINSRATDARIQERLFPNQNVRAFRTSLNTLGDGFVEAIADETLVAISEEQALLTNGEIQGQVIMVPVFEAGGALRVGRFGWKNQQASLVSFSADAYLNEMGITSPLQPFENSSNGMSIAAFDYAADPEDDGDDVETFATFMRATKAPPRDANLAATPEAQAGEQIFNHIGCGICHRPTIVTAPAGAVVNGGAFTIPAALGNKIIHPFGDFLLHDIGTGDGIVQNGGDSTRNKMRTAPLWGLRTHERLMHDGLSFMLKEAIQRHKGEASQVTAKFNALTAQEEQALLAFLGSL